MRYLVTLLILFVVVLSSGCDPEDTSGYNCTPEGCFADPANAQYLTLEDCLSACDEENNTNQSGGPFSFEITLNGNTYAAAGDCATYTGNSTGCTGYGGIVGGLMTINLNSLDPSSDNYISGGYISMGLSCENPFVGINEFSISGTDDWPDYASYHQLSVQSMYLQPYNYISAPYSLAGAYMLDNTTTMADLGYSLTSGGTWISSELYQCPKLTFNITSLGTSDWDPVAAFESGCGFNGENIEGSYSGTIYLLDFSTLSENPTYAEIQEFENMPFTVPLEIEVSFSVPRTS